MGCCGCSLAGSAVTAVVLGLVESIYGLSWNILVIVFMSTKTTSNTTKELTTLSPTDGTEYADDELSIEYSSNASNVSSAELWNILANNLISDLAFDEHMFQILIVALVLNAFWLITTLALAVGNAEKCKDMLKPWIGSTLIITVTDIAATVLFIFKAIKTGESFDYRTSFFTNLYVFYAVMFSRGGIIVWIINITLCVFVAQRSQEIGSGKSKRMPFNSDFNIMPYSLNTPYDAFETESSSRTFKKLSIRPHTPPPDYEGPNGKKRRSSTSSEPETMTLPLSMPSSRASLAQRPLSQSSYLYDDRVELQHRASCAAETVLHHAYENKGLVMESEGWIGIPRPSLKSNHH